MEAARAFFIPFFIFSLLAQSLVLAQRPAPVVQTTFDPSNRNSESQRSKHVKSAASQWLDISARGHCS